MSTRHVRIVSHQIGRPKKEESEKKNNRVIVRLADDTYDELVQYTLKHGLTISDFVRFCVEEILKQESDRERLGYTDDEY